MKRWGRSVFGSFWSLNSVCYHYIKSKVYSCYKIVASLNLHIYWTHLSHQIGIVCIYTCLSLWQIQFTKLSIRSNMHKLLSKVTYQIWCCYHINSKMDLLIQTIMKTNFPLWICIKERFCWRTCPCNISSSLSTHTVDWLQQSVRRKKKNSNHASLLGVLLTFFAKFSALNVLGTIKIGWIIPSRLFALAIAHIYTSNHNAILYKWQCNDNTCNAYIQTNFKWINPNTKKFYVQFCKNIQMWG